MLNLYLWLKLVHILSAAVLFGTGIGIAWFKWSVDRGGQVRAIRVMSERVVVADWLFTSTAVVVQPLSGLGMAQIAGFSWRSGWVGVAMLLYVLIGLCWLPVVALQIRMRTLARVADASNRPLPAAYWRASRLWFLLGIPAFTLLLVVFGLMVFKPA